MVYKCLDYLSEVIMCNFRKILFLISMFRANSQNCLEEISERGIKVKWQETTIGNYISSVPLCYNQNRLITRNCTSSGWSPPLRHVSPCLAVFEYYNLSTCPPSYHKVSEHNNKYCYQIGESSSWNYPCLKSGGASVVTDLAPEDFESMLDSLRKTNTSKFFWLPAQRRKLFNPFVWIIPGPNWGQVIEEISTLPTFASMLQNCLLLDIEKGIITSGVCSKDYPSLCLYLNDLQYAAKCPDGYLSFRFMSDNGTCFGIEQSDNSTGLTFDNFINSKCKKPMGDSIYGKFTRFLFKKIAELNRLENEEWCWFATLAHNVEQTTHHRESSQFQGVINNNGTLGLKPPSLNLPCMACETDVIYYGETELNLEYSPEVMMLHLTIYFPSGLWKYCDKDIGVQCFSDAIGFVKPIEVNSTPIMVVENLEYAETNSTPVEKTVFLIDLVTDRSAQYWCEGHNKTFSLVSTGKIIVNPRGNRVHVFALTIQINIYNETAPDISELTANLTSVFNAEKVLLMDILEYTTNYTIFLLHMHIPLIDVFDDDVTNLQAKFQTLQDRATLDLSAFNAKFINISSSTHCLPTTSNDYLLLEWEQTLIGHIAAPKQFCLQSNGLPVRRQCMGSYLLGGIWGEVEGQCNETYEPTRTTAFLYNFFKGQFSDNYTSRFLTDGLGFVLEDVDVIIPADIYYLAVSLQRVIKIAQENESFVDLGDIENMAWVMDRILLLDYNYLRLAQTFNSTNLILDSVTDIIEKLAEMKLTSDFAPEDAYYQLSVKPHYIVQISYPEFNNITGIAIAKSTDSNSFKDIVVHPLFKNSTLDIVLSIQNLEVATWIPEKLLTSLQKETNDSTNDQLIKKDVHIVINIYHNDAVFQQLDKSKQVINSRIVGLTIPGFKTNLKSPIPVLFKEIKNTNSSKLCGYWDFEAKTSDGIPGFWATQGCFYKISIDNITVCECYHLTNFGQLLDVSDLKRPGASCSQCHTKALNIITLIGCFLSLLGIVGIWMTALVFQTWRKKPGTKVLLQLSTSVALPLIFMVVFNLDNSIFSTQRGQYAVLEHKRVVCIILGALLHYSILASFMWMLITAVLQFIRYVRVLGICRPTRFVVKFAIVGWGLPLIPVIIVLAVDYENYIPIPSTDPEKRICYPTGYYLLLAVIMPIVFILIINVTLFVIILCSISRGPEGKVRVADMDLIGAQLRLSLFLFFLLGLTWLFGIFSFTSNLIWSYLFCLTSTLQGFAIFIYFVVCDPATRGLWVSLMKPQFLASPRKSISSISSS